MRALNHQQAKTTLYSQFVYPQTLHPADLNLAKLFYRTANMKQNKETMLAVTNSLQVLLRRQAARWLINRFIREVSPQNNYLSSNIVPKCRIRETGNLLKVADSRKRRIKIRPGGLLVWL